MHIKKEGYYYAGNVIGQEVVICAYGDADRTWSGRQVYREYDDETYDRGGGKYEQKQSSVDAPGRAKFEHACMISDTVENVGVFVDKYLYEYKVCGLRLHSLRRLEKMCSGLLIVTGLAGAGITCQVYGMGDEALRMGAAGCGLGILVWLFHLTTDENYCMEMAKNYMVDYLENVCLRKYEKMNQKERTVRVNIENGPAEEEIQKDKIQKDEIQKDEIQRDEVQETEAGTEETPAPVPDHSVVHMQRENRRRERTQNTAKNLAKASAGLAGMDGSKSPEAEEQKDAPEELAKDEMIRQILREFMA